MRSRWFLSSALAGCFALGEGLTLGPLNAMGQNQWFARFARAADDYVIESGLASNWVTEAQ
jgi:hypothetical protein